MARLGTNVRDLLATYRRIKLRWLMLVAVVAWSLTGALAGLPAPVAKAGPVDGVSLAATKKVFTLGDRPKLRLHFRHAAKTSWWAPDNVYAESEPKATVEYKGRTDITTATVRPDGADYVVSVGNGTPLKPGKYTVTVSGETTDGQQFSEADTFAYGVLAVNPNKSIYLPGETAQLQMGVLDSEGNTLCSAPLELSVTDPVGRQQTVPYQNSPDCRGNKFTATPDYTASYQTGEPGRYQIKLGIKSTGYAITSSFEVRPNVAFDVARAGVTRVYPIEPNGMSLHVVANQDFTGTITETLSDNRFKILQSAGAAVSTQDGRVVVSWPVRWIKGGVYDLNYQYLAPPVSPALYQLGPLTLTDNAGHQVFEESRSWQVAADAAISLVQQIEKNVNPAPTCSPNCQDTMTGITTTAGDTLILLFYESQTGNAGGLCDTTDGSGCTVKGITDSVGNNWTFGRPQTQNPPANWASGTASEVAIGWVINGTALSSGSITITINGTTTQTFAYDLLEFSNIDNANPIDQSASNDNETAATQHVTSTITATTCDNPTTDQLLRGGDYFCQSVNELVIGMLSAGSSTTSCALQGATGGSPPFTGMPSTATDGWHATTDLVAAPASSNARAAYVITPTSGSYSIQWGSAGSPCGASKKDASAIMAWRQNGNTSGGDEQPDFWAK